jgi:hypothetical protein
MLFAGAYEGWRVPEQAWICFQCHSINDPRDGRCYSCGTARQAGQGKRGPPWRSAALLAIVAVFVVAGGRLLADSGLLQAVAEGQPSLIEQQLGRLPVGDQSALRERARVLAETLSSVGSDQTDERLQEMMVRGVSRLDDEKLVRRLELTGAALGRMDTEFCGGLVRAGLSGKLPSLLHVVAMLSALEPEELADWLDIGLTAAEAELAEGPPRRGLSQPQAASLLERVALRMQATDVDALAAGAEGRLVASSALCRAAIAMYQVSLDLPVKDRAQFALLDVSQ